MQLTMANIATGPAGNVATAAATAASTASFGAISST